MPGAVGGAGVGAVGSARRQPSGKGVKPELKDGVDPGMGALGDVRHVGVAVGRVGLYVVRPNAGFPPFHGLRIQSAVAAESVNPNPRLVVIGRQQILSAAVNGNMHRVALQGDAPDFGKPSGSMVDAVGGKTEIACPPPSGKQKPPLRINGQRRRHPRQRKLSAPRKPAAFRIHFVERNPIFPLQ